MAYKIISVSYGHGSPSGKLYDYTTEKEYRTGDVVVVPVEHYKSHRLYNTLATVQLTSRFDSADGQRKAEHLTDPNNDIKPKDVGLRLTVARRQGLDVNNDRAVNITTLPGYKTRASDESWHGAPEPPLPRLITRGE